MPFLPPNQQRRSTEGIQYKIHTYLNNSNIFQRPHPFYGPFSVTNCTSQCQKTSASGHYGAREISQAHIPTIRLGAAPSTLISDPPPPAPHFFTPDDLPAATLHIYPGLGEAPNMLACIPSGLVIPKANSKRNQLLPEIWKRGSSGEPLPNFMKILPTTLCEMLLTDTNMDRTTKSKHLTTSVLRHNF